MSSSWVLGKEIVLFVVALYGAVLSTFNFIKAAQKERRKMRVSAGSKMATVGSEMGPPWAHIEATNIGQRPVTITRMGFMIDGSHLASISHNTQPAAWKIRVFRSLSTTDRRRGVIAPTEISALRS